MANISSLLITERSTWSADWAWGLPLTVLTVLLHVWVLGVVRVRVLCATSYPILRRHHSAMFVTIICSATLAATVLHGVEATLWAFAYRLLNALPDNRAAMLYSLNAITSYGHANLQLDGRWHLMGAMEALNGWLLFGLNTAFLFAMIERLSSLDNK